MIVCAALKVYLRDKDGEICDAIILPCYRHHEGLTTLHKLNPELASHKLDIQQGFMNNYGNFVDRETALIDFVASGQTSASLREWMDKRHQTMLFSEDLY